ncbi:DUF1249 domain-containing protein [Kaarinaea lacus]
MIKRRRLKNSTALHEANFNKLGKVFPGLKDLKGKITGRGPENTHVEIQVVEQSKYTNTVSLKVKQGTEHAMLPSMHLKIRNYYDACVTEVLAYQDHYRLHPRYNYPNPRMYHCNEKWQTNQFLGEWLDHCLRGRCIFRDNIELLDA